MKEYQRKHIGAPRGLKAALLLLTAAFLGTQMATAHKVAPREKEPKVQIAILLDTSGSMSGLIAQAKTQLWKIVNTFVEAERHGKAPYVEVALYEYGNSRLPSGEYWVRMICPLSRDLDEVSERLFSLRTQGGEEYCGAVIRRAVWELEWDSDPDVYKAIFIAGNEPFTQGPIDPVESCRKASAKGIFVNTIHCGGEQAGLSGGWKSGAMIADGKYLNINHNRQVVHIEAPQDKKILELNIQLNTTYIPYGKQGKVRVAVQQEQDANAFANADSGAAVSRVACKASGNYWNGNWDLVDASKEEGFSWESVKKEDLPEDMRGLSPAECRAKVEAQRQKRAGIQAEIQRLDRERQAYVEGERQKRGGDAGDTLDRVVVDTVKEQATSRGYEFAKT